MAHTNSTTHYQLPQFLSTDKPAWLTDVNPAYDAIDTAIYNAQTAADDAQTDATAAISSALAAGTTASAADAKGSGAVASLADTFDQTATYTEGDCVVYNNLMYVCIVAIDNPGPWTGSANWSRTTTEAEIDKVKGQLGNVVRSALITSSMNTSFADAKTLGYRSTSSDVVDIRYIPGYPTGKQILGYSVEYAYCGELGEWYNIALVNIVDHIAYGNSKIAGLTRFGVRVYYVD